MLNFNFGSINSNNITNIESSSTGEFSLEFWFFLYSYKYDHNYTVNNLLPDFNIDVGFDSFTIQWDGHNRVDIFMDSNRTLTTRCYAQFSEFNPSQSSSIFQEEKSLYNTWNRIQCSTNLPGNLFHLNDLQSISSGGSSSNTSNNKKTYLLFKNGAKYNYGFLWLKDLKLWSFYNDFYRYSDCV